MFEEQPALLIKSSTPQSERGGGGSGNVRTRQRIFHQLFPGEKRRKSRFRYRTFDEKFELFVGEESIGKFRKFCVEIIRARLVEQNPQNRRASDFSALSNDRRGCKFDGDWCREFSHGSGTQISTILASLAWQWNLPERGLRERCTDQRNRIFQELTEADERKRTAASAVGILKTG